MTKISIALIAALSLAGSGCHKDKAKDQVNAGEAFAKLTALKTKMCACPDKSCSEKVSVELTEWDQAHDKAAEGKPAPREEDNKNIEDLKEEISECLLKLEFPRGSGATGSAGAAGSSGAAGSAAGSGGTAGSGGPTAGAADGSAAGAAPAGGSAGGSAGGPAGGGSAH